MERYQTKAAPLEHSLVRNETSYTADREVLYKRDSVPMPTITITEVLKPMAFSVAIEEFASFLEKHIVPLMKDGESSKPFEFSSMLSRRLKNQPVNAEVARRVHTRAADRQTVQVG